MYFFALASENFRFSRHHGSHSPIRCPLSPSTVHLDQDDNEHDVPGGGGLQRQQRPDVAFAGWQKVKNFYHFGACLSGYNNLSGSSGQGRRGQVPTLTSAKP